MVDRIYAQYRVKPKAVEWYNITPTIAVELQQAYDDIRVTYDIDSQVGEQLDVIGRVIVQPRNIIFPVDLPVSECGDTANDCGDAAATEFSSLTGFDNVGLTDEEYRPVLKSKIQINTSDVTIDGIITAINTTLSDSFVSQLNDNEDMTFDIVITGTLTATETLLLNSIGFIPKPQGVGFGGFTAGHTNSGVFTEVSDYVAAGGSSPKGIAVDSNNGNMLVNDQIDDLVYKLTGGVDPFSTSPSAGSGSVQDLSIDQDSSDVWAIDAIQDKAYKQTGGIGSYVEHGLSYPGNNPASVTVNSSNGDVWVSDLNTSIYKLAGGLVGGTWETIGTFQGSKPISIGVNSTTGDLWILNGATSSTSVVYKLAEGSTIYVDTGSYLAGDGFLDVDSSNSDVWVVDDDANELLKLEGGTGSFTFVSNIGTATVGGLAVDQSNGDLWMIDINTPTKGIYKSPGVEI